MDNNIKNIDGSKINVLVAEDEPSNYLLIKELLESSNINCTGVDNGSDAIDILKSKEFDLVLMDLKMPEMGGLEATKQIRKFNKNIPIIAQTAYAFAEDKSKCIKAGCNAYIAKPLNETELFDLIQNNLCN